MSSESEEHSSSSKYERSRSRSRGRRNEKTIRIIIPDLSFPLTSYSNFVAIQREKPPSEVMLKAYDRYRADWQKRQHEQLIFECRVLLSHRSKTHGSSNATTPPWLKTYKPRAKKVSKPMPLASSLFGNKGPTKGYVSASKASVPFSLFRYPSFQIDMLGTIVLPEREEEEFAMNNHAHELHLFSQIDITQKPYFGFDADLNTLFIKHVSRFVSRAELLKIAKALPGFKELTLSDPVKKLNLGRYCWIEFEGEKEAISAESALNGTLVRKEPLIVTKSMSKGRRIKVFRNYPSGRTVRDRQLACTLAHTLDQECGIAANPLLNLNLPESEYLDLILLYLRRVHAYDYFASAHFSNERMLVLKLGSAFLRVEPKYEEIPGVVTVFHKIQENAERRIEKGPEAIDWEQLETEETERFIREKEKSNKNQSKVAWECDHCDKKFSSSEFLAKHMLRKHPKTKAAILSQVVEQAYLRDPHKILLSNLHDEKHFRNRRRNPSRNPNRIREFEDLDEPEISAPTTKTNRKLVNFVDI